MRQRFGDIGAPVPLGALGAIGRKTRIGIERPRPEDHPPTLVEWKLQRVVPVRCTSGGQAEEVSFDRQRVVVAYVGVRRVWHGRIKPRAVLSDASLHGVEELLISV